MGCSSESLSSDSSAKAGPNAGAGVGKDSGGEDSDNASRNSETPGNGANAAQDSGKGTNSAPDFGNATNPVQDSGVAPAESPDWIAVKNSFGILTTIAGAGKSDDGNEWQSSFEGGPATDAELSRPHMALTDAAGNIYIADKLSHGIRKVTPDGTIHTAAGTNVSGNARDSAIPAVEGACEA
jgi:hypothetical protein